MRYFPFFVSLLASMSTLASTPHPKQKRPEATAAARRRVPPCQGQAPNRFLWPNGTLLWGTTRQDTADETSSVLASIDLGNVQLAGGAVKTVLLEKGRLVVPAPGAESLVGAVLQGRSSDGQPVEVALCGAEPDSRDPAVVRYRIEVWNAESETWKNPCIATHRVPTPRVLAVNGVWDQSGARQEAPGKFTFACENGAIAKCIDWGYKPWEMKNGRSLAEMHQACTRMARADYCGNGRSHTREDTAIDMYDRLGLLTRTTMATAGWDPGQASFEAAWTPDGASCLARTRDGAALETILAECPSRFEPKAEDLGEGDRCTMSHKDGHPEAALLRNHSYGN
jgi:hypothetical protein